MKPSLLLTFLLLALTSCAPASPSPTLTPLPSPSPVATMIATVTSSAQISVCTGVTGGKLNVRINANVRAAVLGVLDEGAVVELPENAQPTSGWLAIQSPLSGWVNARFLCGVSQ
jgi:hypothetical protein